MTRRTAPFFLVLRPGLSSKAILDLQEFHSSSTLSTAHLVFLRVSRLCICCFSQTQNPSAAHPVIRAISKGVRIPKWNKTSFSGGTKHTKVSRVPVQTQSYKILSKFPSLSKNDINQQKWRLPLYRNEIIGGLQTSANGVDQCILPRNTWCETGCLAKDGIWTITRLNGLSWLSICGGLVRAQPIFRPNLAPEKAHHGQMRMFSIWLHCCRLDWRPLRYWRLENHSQRTAILCYQETEVQKQVCPDSFRLSSCLMSGWTSGLNWHGDSKLEPVRNVRWLGAWIFSNSKLVAEQSWVVFSFI